MSLSGVHVTIRVAGPVLVLIYAVISFLRSLARYGSRAYLPPLASNTLLVPPTRFPAALGIGTVLPAA